MFDADGYPTDETLNKIQSWPLDDIPGWFAFIGEIWRYEDYFNLKGTYAEISTGGWSGNESIIEAMLENDILWSMCWYSSTRGGHYKFKLPQR